MTPARLLSSARTRGSTLVLATILLIALNLRTAVTSIGALLDEVNGGLRLSPALDSVITMLPAACFAVVGAFTGRIVNRLGETRLLIAAMAALAAGQAVRASTTSTAIFVITSVVALAGIAVSNVLLPGLVKRYFPGRVGLVTGAYTMALSLGTSLAAAASVPVANAAHSWRAGIGVWALAAAVAMVPLLVVTRTPAWTGTAMKAAPRAAGARPRRPVVRVGRTRIGWAMAIFFGAQAFSGYATMGWLAHLFRDAGYSAQAAGLLLAAVTAAGVPIALIMPTIAARRPDQRALVLWLSAAMATSYIGLALAPGSAALLWVTLLAIGQGTFPLALTMIGMRSTTSAGTVALSAFAQSGGYVIAALGPLTVGALYEWTGGWWAPVAALLTMCAVQVVAGLAAARPRLLEDELAR